MIGTRPHTIVQPRPQLCFKRKEEFQRALTFVLILHQSLSKVPKKGSMGYTRTGVSSDCQIGSHLLPCMVFLLLLLLLLLILLLLSLLKSRLSQSLYEGFDLSCLCFHLRSQGPLGAFPSLQSVFQCSAFAVLHLQSII